MKRIGVAFVLFLSLIFCSSCGGSEPEQVYLVSAVGFDGDANGYTLTVEVPVSRGGEKMERLIFVGQGARVEDALQEITVGLSRELSFGHCALMALGDGLSAEQSDAVFSFASSGILLPLAAQVISTPSARDLLEGGSASSPASGYDIPAILREVEDLIGLETRSQIYELRANAKPNRPTVLPLFFSSEEGDPQAAVFGGLSILQRGKEPIRIAVSDCSAYAILADLFRGTEGTASSLGDGKLRLVKSSLSAVPSEEGLFFSLNIVLRAESGTDEAVLGSIQTGVKQETEALFALLKERASGDVVFFDRAEGLGGMQESEYASLFSKAELLVNCSVSGGRKAE